MRLISNDLLPTFRQAVSGSDLNKVGLVEILKKQYAVILFHNMVLDIDISIDSQKSPKT